MIQPFDVVLQECKETYLNDFLAQTIASLEAQGFALNEILDGLANYAWMNNGSTDAVFFLAKASLALRQVTEG